MGAKGLSKDQIQRYGRQLILPEIGVSGQQRLLNASVLIVGAGGLGSPAALYLAAAGVGRLGIIDPETVALSNLHRQILHDTGAVGRPKAESGARRLRALNPEITVEAVQATLGADNAEATLSGYDMILDGSDNFPTRYVVNDACVLLNKPFVHGGVIHTIGQAFTILPRRSACYRCVFPESPAAGTIPSCQEAGVLGAVAGVIGSVMAQEAIKMLAGIGQPLTDRLFVFDGAISRAREVPVRRQPDCAICGDIPTIHRLIQDAPVACAN